MPPGESPAVARRRVRLALRAARESLGLTQGQVAEEMEWSLSKIMRIESGEVTISPIDLKALLACLDVTNVDVIQQLVNDAKASRRRRSWWFDVGYRDHLPSGLLRLVQFEAEASALRFFNIVGVPGLLQTPAYAAAFLDSYSDQLSAQTVDMRKDVRLRRQQEFFSRSDNPELMVILDESVLLREVGGVEVMIPQLKSLLQRAERSRTLIRIVPLTTAAPLAMISPFIIVDLGGEQDSLLYLETSFDDEIIEERHKVSQYRASFEGLWSHALSDADSLRLIEKRLKMMSAGQRRSLSV